MITYKVNTHIYTHIYSKNNRTSYTKMLSSFKINSLERQNVYD